MSVSNICDMLILFLCCFKFQFKAITGMILKKGLYDNLTELKDLFRQYYSKTKQIYILKYDDTIKYRICQYNHFTIKNI